MEKAAVILLLSGLLSASTAIADKRFYEDRERGWYWHEDPRLEKEPEERTEAPAPASSTLSAQERLERQGVEWEAAMAEAIVNPTDENIRLYLEKTTKIQAQSQDFAKRFQETVWLSPEFDHTLNQPSSGDAMQAFNRQQHEDSETRLRSIGDTKGILFYFRGDCPFCHRFAPILSRFSEHFGFTVIPVSLDGGTLPEYPYPKRDNQLSHRLNVEAVPAVFLVDPKRNDVAAIGYGYSDWSELIRKVIVADSRMSEELNVGSRGSR